MFLEANHGEAIYQASKAAAGGDTSLAVEVAKITTIYFGPKVSIEGTTLKPKYIQIGYMEP